MILHGSKVVDTVEVEDNTTDEEISNIFETWLHDSSQVELGWYDVEK